jgi:hypothetical protein
MMSAPPAAPRSITASPAALDGGGWRPRLRRFLVASVLGAAVVVWPAWPTAAHERSARRPAFERALSWREFIRLRLSPWLLLQDVRERIDRDPPPNDQA